MPNLHFRVTDEQKAEIEARAKAAGYEKLSPYLRDRALGMLGVGPETRDEFSKRLAETAAEIFLPPETKTQPVPTATVVESPLGPVVVAEQAAAQDDPPETRGDFIARRTTQLFGQGYTTAQARRKAGTEWDEENPEPDAAA